MYLSQVCRCSVHATSRFSSSLPTASLLRSSSSSVGKSKHLTSLVPRPREKKRVAWYPLFAHVRPFPEKPGNPRMFGNDPYNRYVYVRFISVSSVMAASLLILLACGMVFRQIDAQKVSGSSTLGSCLPLKT